ncbi:MAG: nucleoside-diphosphate kinase [Rickettsiales bacterium]
MQNNIQRTFSMIKPDATKREGVVEQIQAILEANGLKIIEQRKIRLTEEVATEFYAEHKERSFFPDMIKNICSGDVIVQILEGENAVLKNREIMGATNPAAAAEGTIRKMFGLNIDYNSIHGSDSAESAARELAMFF